MSAINYETHNRMDFATGEYKFQAEDVRILKTRVTDAKFVQDMTSFYKMIISLLRTRSEVLKRDFAALSDSIVGFLHCII